MNMELMVNNMNILTKLYLMIISLPVVYLSKEYLGNAIVNCAACQTTIMNAETFNCKVQCDVLKDTGWCNFCKFQAKVKQ